MTPTKRVGDGMPRFGPVSRLALSFAGAGLFLFAVYPRGGVIGDSWLPGPSWLLQPQHVYEDKVVGVVATIALVPAIFLFLIKPDRWSRMLSCAGLVAWIGFGMWLASMAAC